MSGWMIGLSLAGAFAGAACGWVNELTKDWNGGTTKPGALGRFCRATATGAAIGLGAGWLMTDGQTKDEAAMEACFKAMPPGAG
ncbi:MAG: hypothetical protein KJ667_03030, partial [Alphaproteobacteria bacterium]|nr:hypothetical protein [Alphaproteobacteria bacterium]